jgi:4-deoxy-L-threo-5-hexosulose-uronate ketol-isomerase
LQSDLVNWQDEFIKLSEKNHMSELHEVRHCPAPHDIIYYNTQDLRNQFLIENLFVPNKLRLIYTHFDRMVVAGAMPVGEAVKLEPSAYMKTEFFNKDRETGIINVGPKGRVTADGQVFELDYKDALYIGRGVKEILFESDDAENPSRFYINSCLAHKDLPSKKVPRNEANPVHLGNHANTNKRVLNQYIVPWIVETCQLMMGITEVLEGNAWNTMPCHVHTMRMEAYFYFEIPENEAVCHFMGEPQETRHIWLHNENCVLSPDWSLHAAAGTHSYCFIWGMAGSDSEVDPVKTKDLR